MIVRVTLVDLPRDRRAACHARSLVDRFECDLGPDRRGDAIMAVSELVTDAYFHGEGRIRLRLESAGHGLRAEIESARDGVPRDTGGDTRLGIVRSLSDESGVDAAGALTWFEIGTNGRPDPPSAVQAGNGDARAARAGVGR